MINCHNPGINIAMKLRTVFILSVIYSNKQCTSNSLNKTKVMFAVDCPDFGPVENGKATKIDTADIQATHIECNVGFELIGQPKVLCDGGQWENIPRPHCAKPCPPAPFLRNAEVRIDGYSDDEKYRRGSIAVYNCADGFRLYPSSSKFRVCNDGIWAGIPGTCVANGCLLPADIENGYFVMEPMANSQVDNSAEKFKVTVGQRAHYNCDLGYILSGSAILQCIETGEWSPRIPPQCNKILPEDDVKPPTCPPPPTPPNTVSSAATGLAHGVEVELRCQDGYRDIRDSCPTPPGPNILRCGAGAWQGEVPKCVAVNGCGSPPSIRNGALYGLSPDGHYPFRARIAYTCLPGYVLTGNLVLACGSNGCWEPDLVPECRSNEQIFVNTYISSGTVLISLVTALGVMLILLGVCVVVVCRRRRRWVSFHQPVHHQHGVHQHGSHRARRPRHGGVSSTSPLPEHAVGPAATLLHDPDRVALIAFDGEVQLGESALPTYEEAVRERTTSGGLLAYRSHRLHWSSVGPARRPRGTIIGTSHGDSGLVTRQSSSTSHSASLRSGSAGDSMGSTDTMTPSEVSTNVTLDTASSHTCSSSSQTASCRAICGSLASFDTSSVLNTEGVPLLEESEVEDGGPMSAPGLVLNTQVSDSGSFKYRRASPDVADII